MARIRIKRGSEGPRHDPYGYQETTFTRTDGVVLTLYEGLRVALHIKGANGERRIDPHTLMEETGIQDYEDGCRAVMSMFEALAGVSRSRLEEIDARLHGHYDLPYYYA